MSSVVSPYTLKADNPHSTLPEHDFITFGSEGEPQGPGREATRGADEQGRRKGSWKPRQLTKYVRGKIS